MLCQIQKHENFSCQSVCIFWLCFCLCALLWIFILFFIAKFSFHSSCSCRYYLNICKPRISMMIKLNVSVPDVTILKDRGYVILLHFLWFEYQFVSEFAELRFWNRSLQFSDGGVVSLGIITCIQLEFKVPFYDDERWNYVYTIQSIQRKHCCTIVVCKTQQ